MRSRTPSWRSFLSWSAYAAVLLACVVLGSETALRFSKNRLQLRAFLQVHRSMWQQFLNEPTGNPLMPPFVVFANTGMEDPLRLERIAQHARLPRNATFTAPDFLRPISDGTRTEFTVHTNSLGFRDPERMKQKPPRTFRVVCLGAYVTFGHGVADEEAFPRILERRLNSGRGPGPRFEVWNAGRQSSPAIHGLALLETELFEYQPDLLVLEYGFVDEVTAADQFTVVAMRFPTHWLPARIAWRAFRPAADLLTHSYLFAAITQKIQRTYMRRNLSRWMAVMRRIIGEARKRGIPVILLDQLAGLGPPKPLFGELASGEGLRYFRLDDAIRSSPPTAEQLERFKAPDNWSLEWKPFLKLRDRDGNAILPTLTIAPYLTDIFHPNRWGHDAIARSLEIPVRNFAAYPRKKAVR